MENKKQKVRYNLELLQEVERRDGATIDENFKQQCINKEIKLNREIKVPFKCKCGVKHNKNFRQCNKTGMICEECCLIKRCKKKGFNRWTKKSIHKYLLKYTFFWNIIQFLLTKNKKEYKWKIPSYRWWNRYHKKILSAINKLQIKFQNLLDTYGQKTKRVKGELKDETKLIQKIREIYDNEGIEGLIVKNLNNKHNCLFNTYIRKLTIKKDKKTPNYPDLWCCEKLGIIKERKDYLKKKFPAECETFEELCEIHIRPILIDILKKNNGILDSTWFLENKHSPIILSVRNLGYNIEHVRNYFNCRCKKNISYYNIVCDSQAECYFDNWMYKRDYNNTFKYKKGGKYPEDFNKKFNITKKSKYTLDRIFYSPVKNKWINVEIWGWSEDDGKNNTEYLSRKHKKQEYWSCKSEEEFLGIFYEDVKKPKKIKKIMEPYIGIIEPKELKEEFLLEFFKYDEKQQMMYKIKELKNNSEDGLIPSYSVLPLNLKNWISRNTDGILSIREELGEDLNEVKIRGIKKRKQTVKNFSEEKKKSIIEKQKKTKNNWSEEKRKSIGQKISETRKKRGISSKGENNPMYGKKGENNPNFGKKYPPEDYNKKWCPIMIDFLEQLPNRFFNGSIWYKYSKEKKISGHFWNNPSEYNVWRNSGLEGVLKDTYKYADENNIKLPKNFMIVENIKWANLHIENRNKFINFVKENKTLPKHRKDSTLKNEKKLADWYYDIKKNNKNGKTQPYYKETFEIINKLLIEYNL